MLIRMRDALDLKELNLIEKCQIMPKIHLWKTMVSKVTSYNIDQLKPVIFIHVPLNNTKY